MPKWEDLNEDPDKWFARTQSKILREAQRNNTRPTGVKVLGENGDLVWSDEDGDRSVREVDAELQAAQDDFVRVDQIVTEAKESLDELENVTLPAAVERLEQADAEAQGKFVELDERLGAFATDEALSPIRQALTAAQNAVDAAQQVATEANTAANAASQAALEAAGIAASKGRVIVQETEPMGEDRKSSNIWIQPVPDDPDTEVEEKAVTYVYLEATDEWQPTTSSELAQAAQNALDAREAAQQAQQRADTAIANAATAQAAAEAAQSTADEATTEARAAWNGAVAAQAAADDALEKYGPLDQRTIDAQEAADAAQAHADAAMAEASAAKGLAEEAVREVGDTVRDTAIEYAVNTSETTAPTSGWSTSTPTRTPGSFVWMRTIVTYADGDTSTTSPALLTGNDGAKGDKGATGAKGDKGDRGTDGVAGKDGVGLSSTALAYALSTSGTTAPSSGWAAAPPTPIKGRYLWTRTTWTYTDSTTETGYSVAYLATDGAKGNDGIAGKDGVGIKSTAITYASSSSGTTAPSSGWSSQPPAATAGQYVWTRTIWTYTDNTTETGYSVGKIGNTGAKGATGATGPKGDKGSTGAQGVSVSSVTPFFRTVARTAGAPAQPSGMTPSGWVTTEPAWSASTKLYRAERIVYSNGTVSWTVPTLVAAYEGIVQVQTSVNGKNSITRSTSNASGSGVVAGDAWYKVDSNGDTMAMWIWSGSKWVASKVRNEMIDTIDVNKLKVHDSLEVVGEAVINKLWADGIAAKAITTSRLTVAPGNIYRDPMLTDPASWNSRYFQTSGGYGGGGSIVLPATTSQTGTYDTLGTSVAATRTRVEPGATYRLTFWFRSNIPVTARNRVVMFRRYYALDGTLVGGTIAPAQADPTPANTWAQASGEDTVPEDGVTMVVGFYTQSGHNGEVRFSDPAIVPKVGAVLIEDGAVTAKKITLVGNPNDPDEVALSASVAEIIKAKFTDIVVTGEAIIEGLIVNGGLKMYDTAGQLTARIDGKNNLLTGNFQTDRTGARVAIYREGDTGFADGVGIEFLGTEPSGANSTGPSIYAPGVAARGSLRIESGSKGFDPGWNGSPSSYVDMQTDALEVGYGVQGIEGNASSLKATRQALQISSRTVRVNGQTIGPGEWVTATKTAQWTGPGTGTLEYMIQNGVVYWAGELSRSSTTSSGWHQITPTLPAEIRPTRNQIVEAPTSSSVKILLQIPPPGRTAAGALQVWFSGTFPANTTVHISPLKYPTG